MIQCEMCVVHAEREMDEDSPGRQLDSEYRCDLLCRGWLEMFILLEVFISVDPGSFRKLSFWVKFFPAWFQPCDD